MHTIQHYSNDSAIIYVQVYTSNIIFSFVSLCAKFHIPEATEMASMKMQMMGISCKITSFIWIQRNGACVISLFSKRHFLYLNQDIVCYSIIRRNSEISRCKRKIIFFPLFSFIFHNVQKEIPNIFQNNVNNSNEGS